MWLNLTAPRTHSKLCVIAVLSVGIMVFSCVTFPLPSHAQINDDIPLLSEIIIEGNEKTDRDLIINEMGLQFGEPFSKLDMDQVWDMLEDIGYFAFVDMEYDSSDGEEVILRIYLEEEMTTHYSPSILYSRRFKYELGAWIEEDNLRGKGETLKLEAYAYRRLRGRLTWTKPWLLGVKGLESSVGLGAEKAGFVFRSTDYSKMDADLQISKHFPAGLFALAGINFGNFDQKDDYSWHLPDRGEGTPGPVELYGATKYSHTAWRAAVGLDSRNNPYYPRRGVFVEAMVKQWSSAQIENYTETTIDSRVFVPVKWGHILALRAWGRQTNNPTQLDNMLFFGGPETLRGQDYALLEGEEGYLLSAEYRIPLFMMPISPNGEMVGTGIHLFYDAGDAWFHGAEAGQALQSYGAGIHLNIDKQQFRFEAARAKNGEWSFEFMDHFNF